MFAYIVLMKNSENYYNMFNPTDEFKTLWGADDGKDSNADNVRQHIMQGVRSPQQRSINAQVGTIVVLASLIIILVVFFKYLSPVETSLSDLGKGLMIGSIIGRIFVEFMGIYLARRIDVFENVATFVQKSKKYVQFRNRVHRYMVIVTFISYSIGYYLLIPEWSNYFSSPMIWLLISSYLVIMVVVFFLAIRPGIRGEKEALRELETLANDLEKGEL